MPASRSARAMTLAPRSWPSRPGLAMRTLILRSTCPPGWARPSGRRGAREAGRHSDQHRLLVDAVYLPEHVHLLAQRAERVRARHEGRHRVAALAGRRLELGQRRPGLGGVALAPDPRQALLLHLGDAGVDELDRHLGVVLDVLVHAHDDAALVVDLALGVPAGVADLAGEEAVLDRGLDAAELVDLRR